MPDSPLDAKLSTVMGTSPTSVSFAKQLKLATVGDLLSHYPRRYVRRGELTGVSELPLGESVTIVAEVVGVRERKMQVREGHILEVRITDGTGILTLTFFNQRFRVKELVRGARGIFAGKVGEYGGSLQLAHPDYELFAADSANGRGEEAVEAWAMLPIPIYAATASVPSWRIQNAIKVVLDTLPELADPVPAAVRRSRKLMGFSRALELVHRPVTDADWAGARKSLRFQEAFVLQAALLQQRALVRRQAAVSRIPQPGGLLQRFDAVTPFTLTSDQAAVGRQIAGDLASATPMNRLLQGEVGSGKTLVALRGMLAVAESGGQAALLAPTEVLAGQHLRSIVKTLGPDLAAELRPTLITGQQPIADRRKATLAAVSGQARIVIGTHALMSEKVGFFDLGLVIVDEQHRFGVEQREALRRKGAVPPHVLVLTATPIPRTVAMTVFGDLDVSTIAELPSGRIPIVSHVVALAEHPGWIARVWARIAEEVALGRQAFVVCPAIDSVDLEDDAAGDLGGSSASADANASTNASANSQAQARARASTGGRSGGAAASQTTGAAPAPPRANVTDVLAELRANPHLSEARIEQLHGRLPGEQKDAIMRAFAAGDIDVLVATTVIEVGVDVPNASVMAVLDADRFGVSQLHQLRGRVGRGSVPGLCLMVTHAEGESLSRERVEAVASTLDGFELAEKDLELRQEGDVLGRGQSGGRSSLRLLRVAKDGALITEARAIAEAVLEVDPELADYPELRQALTRRLDETSRDFLAKN